MLPPRRSGAYVARATVGSLCYDAFVSTVLAHYPGNVSCFVLAVAIKFWCSMRLATATEVVDPHGLARKGCLVWSCSNLIVASVLVNIWLFVELSSFVDLRALILCRCVDIVTFVGSSCSRPSSIPPHMMRHECTFKELIAIHGETEAAWTPMSCCSCLEEIQSDDVVVEFQCHHVSHMICAERYLSPERRGRHLPEQGYLSARCPMRY
eukprot:TRINITY_DN41682_c0_g1_i1.p1 TRINITY_DN41682_c0_g1~~TRINITY_DN41682_c0_g1_i1.p1  ORF type:complete len:209 (-),score=4.52 TRINITY_DN41682_c0_g1_i1:101-727(-)